MPTYIEPRRRVRIHRQRGFSTWAAYCPCCWNFNGTGLPQPYATFEGARDWAVEHIELWHSRALVESLKAGPSAVRN